MRSVWACTVAANKSSLLAFHSYKSFVFPFALKGVHYWSPNEWVGLLQQTCMCGCWTSSPRLYNIGLAGGCVSASVTFQDWWYDFMMDIFSLILLDTFILFIESIWGWVRKADRCKNLQLPLWMWRKQLKVCWFLYICMQWMPSRLEQTYNLKICTATLVLKLFLCGQTAHYSNYHSQVNSGVSTIRPGGQNRPSRDSNPAHWNVLEKVMNSINFGRYYKFYSFSYWERPTPWKFVLLQSN